MYKISISNTFNIYIKCLRGMNIFDRLSRKSSFIMHVPYYSYINMCNEIGSSDLIIYLSLHANILLIEYICFLHTPFILHITFFECIIFSWLLHFFFKYACIFLNAWSCVLVCYICFCIHHSYYTYTFLHAWNFHDWYIFLKICMLIYK